MIIKLVTIFKENISLLKLIFSEQTESELVKAVNVAGAIRKLRIRSRLRHSCMQNKTFSKIL